MKGEKWDKVDISIPATVRKWYAAEAKRKGLSLGGLVREVLNSYMVMQEKEARAIPISTKLQTIQARGPVRDIKR